MMSQHLDIKLFTEILKEIKDVSFKNQRSVSTNIDIFGASDTDREDDFIPGDRAELKPPPITPLSRSPRGSSRANSFKKVQLKKCQGIQATSSTHYFLDASLHDGQFGGAAWHRPPHHTGDDF